MAAQVWLTRVGGAGVLALAMSACDQPTGLVVSVYGAERADALRLTVGGAPVVAAAKQPRFLQTEESGEISHAGPYSDGFEIYLERKALQDLPKVALVLDAAVDSAGLEILRDTYVIEPTRDALVEVRLTPSSLAPGQWVCPGRARQPGEPGFATVADATEVDCDRDGWFQGDDPDDVDPLATGMVGFQLRELRCGISLGDHRLAPVFNPLACGGCQFPDNVGDAENCLSALEVVACTVPRPSNDSVAQATFAIKDLVPKVANPQWELAKIWPSVRAVSGYFAPSITSKEADWMVTFSNVGALPGWFVLTDRAHQTSTLISVKFGTGGEPKCEVK